MKPVCFDTHIVMWAVQDESQPEHAEFAQRAKYLLRRCFDGGVKVIIPAVVMAELMAVLEPSQYANFVQTMQKRFIVAPFDLQATMHYAQIWQLKQAWREDTLRKNQATGEELRTDCLIVSTAVANQVSCLYTHDDRLRQFAHNVIETRGMPQLPPMMTQTTFIES